jgi:hypothetical protein
MTVITNTALIANRNQFNKFTYNLALTCKTEGAHLVSLRNGQMIRVCFEQDAESDKQMFRTTDWSKVWYADGSSYSSSDFDIIAFDYEPVRVRDRALPDC